MIKKRAKSSAMAASTWLLAATAHRLKGHAPAFLTVKVGLDLSNLHQIRITLLVYRLNATPTI